MLKYNLKALITSKGGSVEGIKTLRESICKKTQITNGTLSVWCNLKAGQTTSAPADKLRSIAQHLEVDINALFNEPVKA